MRHSHRDIGHSPAVIAGAVFKREFGHVFDENPATLNGSVIIQHREWLLMIRGSVSPFSGKR